MFVLSKVTAEKTFLYNNQLPASMYHSGKALKECLQARLPVQHAQHPISDVNTSQISREGRRLVNGYTAWALGITSLLISLNPREKIHNKRTWITAYLTDGATRLGPVGMRTRAPDPPRLREAAVTGQALVTSAHYCIEHQHGIFKGKALVPFNFVRWMLSYFYFGT